MKVKEAFKKITAETLDKMSLVKSSFNSKEAVDLIYETACVESGGFKYLKQVNGPALGFTQLEPNTVMDCWDNYIGFRETLKHFFEVELNFNPEDLEYCILSNVALQIAFARIVYYRRPGAIPPTMGGRAAYWKKYYNTSLGKGTIDHYLSLNNKEK